MTCPKCRSEMAKVSYGAIEVNRCVRCDGLWFDMLEVEHLETIAGSEEIDIIGPAVAEASRIGIDAAGPIAADSVFALTIGGRFDVVVAMTHDQGHIAVKTHAFERCATVTLGLPFVRTTTAHGTAFDIAGKNVANSGNMEEAIRLAARYAASMRKTPRA